MAPAPANAIDPRTLPASHPLNPDTYAMGGGRLTGYEATIVDAYYDAYRGKTKGEGDKYFPYLVFELDDVKLADGEPHEPIVNRYLAGWLAPGRDKKTGEFYTDRVTGQPLPGVMPSDDGINPVGATVEEYRALGEGKASIEPGTEAQYRGKRTCGARVKGAKKKDDRAAPAWYVAESIALAPVDGSDETWSGWTSDGWAKDFIGLRCLFDSVDKPGSDGVMLVTRILEAPAPGTQVAKPASAAKPTMPGTTVIAPAPANVVAIAANGNAAVDAEIAALLVDAASKSPTSSLTLLEAANVVLAGRGPKDAPRVKDASIHAAAATLAAIAHGKSWVYDGVKMTLTAAS